MLRLFAIIDKPPFDDTFIIGKSQINVYLTVTRMTDHGRHSHVLAKVVITILAAAILAAAIFAVAILATTILTMAILTMAILAMGVNRRGS